MLTRINTEALHDYVREFMQLVCDKFYTENDVITGEQLFTITPVAQINLMLVSELYDKWKSETLALRSPFFDFENVKIKELLDQLTNSLSEHISIKRENFEPLLSDATYQTLQLLLDPKEYFIGIYKSQPELCVQRTLIDQQQKYLRINAFVLKSVADAMGDAPFLYATDAITAVEEIIDTEPESLENKEPWLAMFAEVLPVPTDNIIKQFPSIDVSNLSFFDKATHSIDELLAKYRQGINNSIAAATPAVVAISQPVEELPATTIEIPAVETVTEKITPVIETPVVIAETVIEAPKIEPVVEVAAPIVVEPPVMAMSMAMVQEPAAEISVAAVETPATVVQETPEVSEVVLPSKANHTRKPPIVSLSIGVPLHQKFLFIQELFGGSPADYERVVEELDNAPDYAAARELVNFKYASKYMWDMSSDTVSELADFVKRRFDEL
jgi:hypothetical protein